MFSNMDEPWRHYAKWNVRVTKEQLLYDSSYRRSLDWTVKFTETENWIMVPKNWGKEGWMIYCLMFIEFQFEMKKKFWRWTVVTVA